MTNSYQLTKNFSLSELEASSTAKAKGIDNSVPFELMPNIHKLADGLQLVRDLLGQPMIISSGYRSPALNKAVGGVLNSSHANGEAVDFISPKFGNTQKICEAIIKSGIKFDQLIKERNLKGSEWVHIGFGSQMRQEVLTYKGGRYYKGLV